MITAEDLGASWCDHCHRPFDPAEQVDATQGLFFHPDCPHVLPGPGPA